MEFMIYSWLIYSHLWYEWCHSSCHDSHSNFRTSVNGPPCRWNPSEPLWDLGVRRLGSRTNSWIWKMKGSCCHTAFLWGKWSKKLQSSNIIKSWACFQSALSAASWFVSTNNTPCSASLWISNGGPLKTAQTDYLAKQFLFFFPHLETIEKCCGWQSVVGQRQPWWAPNPVIIAFSNLQISRDPMLKHPRLLLNFTSLHHVTSPVLKFKSC